MMWLTRFISCVRFSLQYLPSVKRKRLTRYVIKTVFPVPIYRSVFLAAKGVMSYHMFKKIAIPASLNTFSFDLHTGTLRVKISLHEKNKFVSWYINCSLCKAPETMKRVILDCWDAFLFWDDVKRTNKKHLNISMISVSFCRKTAELPVDFVLILSLNAIWPCRVAVGNAEVHARYVKM